jgi:hypothetical protein
MGPEVSLSINIFKPASRISDVLFSVHLLTGITKSSEKPVKNLDVGSVTWHLWQPNTFFT